MKINKTTHEWLSDKLDCLLLALSISMLVTMVAFIASIVCSFIELCPWGTTEFYAILMGTSVSVALLISIVMIVFIDAYNCLFKEKL